MPMRELSSHGPAKAQWQLGRLAEALGCSKAAFSTAQTSALNQASELVTLWLMIPDMQDRAKVIACARTLADRALTPKAAE